MKMEDFCRTFEITPADRLKLTPLWEELSVNWQENSLPFCLDLDSFKQLYPLCKGSAPLEKVLPMAEAIVALARKTPAVSLLAHISCRGAFEQKTPFFFDAMPDPIPLLGKELSGMFAFMISLGAYPHIVKAYAECGVPKSYANDALQWFGGTMYAYGIAHENTPGRPFQFAWIRRYIDKTLFRIGRLEYLMHPYISWMPAVYRSKTGALAVLARDGWKFRTVEYRADDKEPCIFVSRLVEDEKRITGTPIPPDGIMDFSKQITLLKAEWTPVASPWALCPSIHIPGGCRMPWNEVKESIIRAREFFSKYFHCEIPLVCCCSWILNPAWETELENSNMAEFRRQGYAFPGVSWGDRAGEGFLFGRSDVPPDELVAVNAAQRAMQRCYKQQRCGSGALFILAEDMEKTGAEYYRSGSVPRMD